MSETKRWPVSSCAHGAGCRVCKALSAARNIMWAKRQGEPLVSLHIHFWEYVTVVPDVESGEEHTWTRRVCRDCRGWEDMR